MKVALVMKDYDTERGGAERYLVEFASKLAGAGVSVDLVAGRFKTRPPAGVNARKVKAVMWSSVIRPLSFNLGVGRLLKRADYDLVYGLTQIYPQDVYRAGGGLQYKWLQIRYPGKWLRFFNSIRPRMLVRLYIEGRIFKRGNFKKIIANSLYCKYQILERYKISPEDIVVVYNGVDRRRFSPEVKSLYRGSVRGELNIPFKDKVVLFISNNWARKGLRELIKAIACLKHPGPVWLVVLGRGRPREYRRLTERLGVQERVIFAGHTDRPWEYYGAADLFVLPTYYDPFSNVVLEALACGVPVVTTMANGARELVINGKNGYLVDTPGDITKLAGYIEDILERTDPGQAEREAVASVQGFTMDKNVSETLDVFKEVLEKKRDNSPLAGDSVLVNNGYGDLLKEKGWTGFKSIMNISGGELYKQNRLRSVVKICSNNKGFFLKRHFRRAVPSWALVEWQNIFTLKALGFATMEPVAVGEERRGKESFLVTESLGQAQRLEDFIPGYFPALSGRERFSEKRRLINRLAGLTRRLHKRSLFHKDFYTGHIFVEKKDDDFELYLIDLQRLREHSLFRKRWYIKDLASLNFSCPAGAGIITNTDRLRFLKCYLGVEDFNKRGKDFIRRIIRKTEKIARHTRKRYARKN